MWFNLIYPGANIQKGCGKHMKKRVWIMIYVYGDLAGFLLTHRYCDSGKSPRIAMG